VKLTFLMEYMYRLQDYFFYQLLGALSDSNPYWPIIQEELFKMEDDFDRQLQARMRQSRPSKKEQKKQVQSNRDLKQYLKCTGLDMKLHHPQIILKDRVYLKRGKLKIDFGVISVSNQT